MKHFYKAQPQEQREKYKNMLKAIGSLSRLFSASDKPFLYYRAHENAFCYAFEAENLARGDDSADAKKGLIGIGLKTWVGRGDQKVAEFGELRPQYKDLSGLELVKKISEYRNLRINTTMKIHGLEEMLYHVVRRNAKDGCGFMEILEMEFDPIDIDHIRLLKNKGNENNTYFTDGKHTYHFSTAKNTLYMIFDDLQLMETFDVSIKEDIFDQLEDIYNMLFGKSVAPSTISKEEKAKAAFDFFMEKPGPKYETLCLRLYSTKGSEEKGTLKKFVGEKSGLNQWRAAGRPRDPNELYIPYPAEDRRRIPSFFPPRDTPFDLQLPDGKWISAKVCQGGDKAIMSNPNKILGKWLLRDVFQLPEGTVITYDDLLKFGVDSVLFTKLGDNKYTVDFCEIGTYEKMAFEFGDAEDEGTK